jgi:uncharacterized protein (TIGR02246 family)
MEEIMVRHGDICAGIVLLLIGFAFAQQTSSREKTGASQAFLRATAAETDLRQMFEDKVKAEWEAFKNKDKKAYGDLLADDFIAVEDDGEGTRSKYAAINEVDRSVVNNYLLRMVSVRPLAPDVAFITYEVTMVFPPKAQVRYKRVYVTEVWTRRDGQWKEQHYQETRVR